MPIKLLSILLFVITALSTGEARTQQKSVFGPDDRDRITQTGMAPYLRIGQVGNTCTGFMIGESHVLTAAKCVFDHINNKWIDGIYFTPARDEEQTPFGIRDWEKVHVHQNFAQKGLSDWNFAVIKLKKPLGRSTGYFSLPSTDNYAGPVEIPGYPMDKPINTMWTSSCFANTRSNHLYYKCDTYAGMSGAPILVETNGGHTAYGIHINEGIEENSALYLGNLKRYYINRWMTDNTPGGTLTNNNPHANNEIKFNNIWLKNNCGLNLNFKLKYTDTDGVLREMESSLAFSEENFMFKTRTSVYFIKIEDSEWMEMKITDSQWGKVIDYLPCQYPYDYWYVTPISPL
ncbi:MAG: trypsin-like serine protease [Deltaproteobacteria bacterium]|nr:MAG: trypsin-like serine protease [Deltaproteobacteria bacterium]